MERGDVAFVAGVAGFLLGGVALFIAIDARRETSGRWADVENTMKSDSDSLGGLGEKVKNLEESTASMNRKVGSLANDPKIWEAIRILQARVDALKQGEGPPKLKDGAPQAPDQKSGSAPADFDALRDKVLAGTAT